MFKLFGTHEAALKNPDLEIDHFVLVFKHSVRGLAVGAPVDFRGVTIGEVLRIGVEFDPKAFNFVQPVEVHLYPHRMRIRSDDMGAVLPVLQTQEARLRRYALFVERGFRAQLRTGNLLTGSSTSRSTYSPTRQKQSSTPRSGPSRSRRSRARSRTSRRRSRASSRSSTGCNTSRSVRTCAR